MSETAKSARAAMKAKAQRLGGKDRPLEKVDSSSWSPPEMLNADVKTGLRPLSRRAYKSGGKVKGELAKARADRPKRKNGGSALTADSLINRNVKSANAEREGAGKHVGGFKKGGRAEKCGGGSMKRGKYANRGAVDRLRDAVGLDSPDYAPKSTGKSTYTPPSDADRDALAAMSAKAADTRSNQEAQRKHGGRAKKFMGGPLMQPGGLIAGAAPAAGPSGMPAGSGMPGTTPAPIDPRLGIVSKNAMNFSGAQGSPYKKGGAVKHSDEAADKALIKKMVKPSARTGKSGGGETKNDFLSPVGQKKRRLDELKQQMLRANLKTTSKGDWGDMQAERSRLEDDLSQAYKSTRDTRATGGKVFTGAGYPHKVPGADGGRTAKAGGGMLDATKRAMMLANDPHVKSSRVTVDQPPPAPQGDKKKHGGRTARASGGRAPKGRTTVNVIVATGKGNVPPAGIVPSPAGSPAGIGRPVTVPPPPTGGGGAAPMPMPIPMPMPMGGAGAPTGAPPMPRKAGGRITKVAKSYKDMEAGAGSGEGRLQKTDIAKRSMHNKGGKVGHRNYRNYEDMDAGAGGGFGRLEKTEIARKGTGIQKAY